MCGIFFKRLSINNPNWFWNHMTFQSDMHQAITMIILPKGHHTVQAINKLSGSCMAIALTHDKATLVRVIAWCRQATSYCLSPGWSTSMLLYGVTRPQLITWPALVWVMTDCLNTSLVPNHYLKQCWLVINGILWHSPDTNGTLDAQKHRSLINFETKASKFTGTLYQALE